MNKKILGAEIMNLFKPYRKNIVMISLTMFLTAVGSFFTPWLTKQLFDLGIIAGDFSQTLQYILVIMGLFIVQQLIELVQFNYYSQISIMIPYDLNLKASKHILSVRIKYFKDRNFSEIMGEIYQDIANISSLADSNFLAAFVNLFKILAGIIALLIINWKLTLIMLATIPLRIFLSRYLFSKQTSIFKKIMENTSKFSAWLGDSVSGIVEIKMWGLIEKRLKQLNYILAGTNKEKRKLLFCGQLGLMAGSTLSIVFTYLLYLFGAAMIGDNQLTVGGLISFISYSALVFEPISVMSSLITHLSTIIPAFERFSRFMDSEAEVDDPNSIEFPTNSEITNLKFENISLLYENEKVLINVNFEIKKGEKVAIIGSNGSGKTSLINLLLGFYVPTEGQIKINELNIQQFKIVSYRSIFSLMAQSNYLFNNSIKDNINLDESLSDKEILDSCIKSGALHFIEEFKDGLNAQVGYNGSKLSGGQRQKISLARTLSKKDTKILILDEATSNFDYSSENDFNKILISSNHYDITIIITHRPEILKSMDKIIYLDRGKVVASGTYEEIYSMDEGFRNMIININLQEEDNNAIYSVQN